MARNRQNVAVWAEVLLVATREPRVHDTPEFSALAANELHTDSTET
jgi:hypothetical protein